MKINSLSKVMACKGWEQIKNKKYIETFKQHAVSSALAI